MAVHGNPYHIVSTSFDWKRKEWLALSLILEGGNIVVADEKSVEEGYFAQAVFSGDYNIDLLYY